MKILALETSCDDTAFAVVENGKKVLGMARTSQNEHNKFGGVVPEIAARLHTENWRPTLEKCLKESKISPAEIDYIAVTQGPGLQTSLLVGTTVANFLGLFWGKKIIPVQHILGHISSVQLEREENEIKFPNLVLTVSGGHTNMIFQKSRNNIEVIGKTLDDACGEAFDKVAKMLGLGYPGGKLVSEQAEKGDRQKYDFPKIFLRKNCLDFSFSGLKSAVFRELEEKKITTKIITDICASFEFTVGNIFLNRFKRVLQKFPEIKQVHFVGGVSANTYLNQKFREFFKEKNIELLTPKNLEYCTDNGAMIGSAAYFLVKENPQIATTEFIDAQSKMKIRTY